MSTDQPVSPEAVEESRREIRLLVGEIARLARSDLEPGEFCAEFLRRTVSALVAVGGAVWTVEEGEGLALQCQVNLGQAGLAEKSNEDQARHGRLLQKVFSGGEGLLVLPHSVSENSVSENSVSENSVSENSVSENGQQAGNPTDYLLVLAPLKTDLKTIGVLEIFQRPDTASEAQRGYLRFALQMCELAGDFFRARQLRSLSDRQVLWSQLEEFARTVHSSLDVRRTVYTIANEGRRLIECDRLSVAVAGGGKCTIEAVSGQDVFEKRSNTVRLLGKLAGMVAETREPIWYTGQTSDMAPQVEEVIQEYVDQSQSKAVGAVPLLRPKADSDCQEPDRDQDEEAEQVVGVLIVERIEDSRVPESMLGRIDFVSQHGGSALANAWEHENVFLMPVWKALGKTKWVVKARTLPKTVAVLAAAIVVLATLLLWPASFEMEASGRLEPVLRRNIFATQDGRVEEVLVDHGDRVSAGQPLLRLRSTELEMDLAAVTGRQTTVRQQMHTIRRLLLEESDLTVEHHNRLSGQLAELKQELESLDQKLGLYKRKQKELLVTAPSDGVVMTWELRDQLAGRPVGRGQFLMQVADPEGPWQLELRMPEDQVGHVLQSQREQKEKLKVTYILATDPGTERTGRVVEVHRAAEVRGEEGNTVLIKVTLDDAPDAAGDGQLADQHHAGAELTARVHCGRRCLGYVLFHDVIAFIQSRILFRL
jgi:multidrug efflux pump subunit AcrA (membrane-fusion protein)